MAVLGARKWAIILCEFSDVSGIPVTVDFCEKFFITKGTGGLYDYWNDLSYEKFSLNGSVVLGPFNLSYTLDEAQTSARDQNIASHSDPDKRTHGRFFRAQDAIDDICKGRLCVSRGNDATNTDLCVADVGSIDDRDIRYQ